MCHPFDYGNINNAQSVNRPSLASSKTPVCATSVTGTGNCISWCWLRHLLHVISKMDNQRWTIEKLPMPTVGNPRRMPNCPHFDGLLLRCVARPRKALKQAFHSSIVIVLGITCRNEINCNVAGSRTRCLISSTHTGTSKSVKRRRKGSWCALPSLASTNSGDIHWW